MARELGVTPQRVHQLQSSGALAEPEQGDDVVAWPDAYATSFVGRRQGRVVSQSVYGLSPSPVAAEFVDDVVLDLQKEDRFQVHAMRFDHPDAPVVFLQPLAFDLGVEFAGVVRSGSARWVFSDEDALGLAAKRAAEHWFDGDIARAAFVLVGEKHGGSEFFDMVVTYEESDGRRRPPAPHWLDVRSSHERIPDVKASEITALVLQGRLGRPIPAFLPDQFTAAVLEQWQAGGRRPIEIARDYDGYERSVVAATIVHSLPELSREIRDVLAAALLERVQWEESGSLPRLPKHAAAGLADWNDDVAAIDPQLILRQPDFAARAGAVRDLPQGDVLEPSAFTAVANRVRDVVFNVYGEYGSSPSPRVEAALDAALNAVYNQTWTATNKQGWYDEIASMKPNGTAPFAFRSWSDRSGYVHELSEIHARGLSGGLLPDDAAFRAIRAQLLESARHYVDGEALQRLEPTLSRDVGGVRIGSLDVGAETLYCAAVPVLRDPDDLHDPARSFTAIVVEPMTQEGPVYLDTPAGPTLMPFGDPYPGPFTHGYSGTGPRNLRTALGEFLSHVVARPVPNQVDEFIAAAIHAADQSGALVIPRNLLLPG